MTLLASTAVASCADILRSCQSPEDTSNLVRGIVKLKKALGEEGGSQFVDNVFQVGSNQFQQLLKDSDLEETYRHVFTLAESSSRQPPAVIENTDNPLPDSGPSVPIARMVGEAADPCDCPPRKAPYKTVRGLREHLMIKHGLSQAEAEAEAQGAFARLQSENQHCARYGSQSLSPARNYTTQERDVLYGEFGLNCVVADQVALPDWNMRS